MNTSTYRILATLVNAVLAIIAFFLLANLILKFFSANPATPVVSWIYSVSSFIISPFAGMVPNISTTTGVLDIVSVISLLFYLAAGYLLLGLIQNFTRPTTVLEEEEYPEEEYSEEAYPRTVHYHKIPKQKRERSKPNR